MALLLFFLTRYHICTHGTSHHPLPRHTRTLLFQGHSSSTDPGVYPSFSILFKLNQQANYYPSFKKKKHVFNSSLSLVSLKFSPDQPSENWLHVTLFQKWKITLQNGTVMPHLDISRHFRTTEKRFFKSSK